MLNLPFYAAVTAIFSNAPGFFCKIGVNLIFKM